MCLCECVCMSVCNGPDESVRAEGRGWCDCWQAPSMPAESPNRLRAPPRPPINPAPLLLSQSWAPHICCVLAMDSKLQHPGPLSNSILIPSFHVPRSSPSLPAAPLSSSPSLRLSVSLLPLVLIRSPPSSVCHIRPGSSTPSTLSDFSPLSVFSLTSVILLILRSSIVSRYTAFPPLHIPFTPPLLSYTQVPVV